MSDVDAVRFLASEHDLEFVDLDNYGVDTAAAEVIPAAVARRHQVVPVKRKFGTPVVAIANPDDVFTLDTVRASIGRDFISVVAAGDQIDRWLDQLYGPSDGAPAAPPPPPAPPASEPPAAESADSGDVDSALGLSMFGAAFAPPPTEELAADAFAAAGVDGAELPPPTTNGNGTHLGATESLVAPAADDEWQDLMASPMVVDSPDAEDLFPVPPADDAGIASDDAGAAVDIEASVPVDGGDADAPSDLAPELETSLPEVEPAVPDADAALPEPPVVSDEVEVPEVQAPADDAGTTVPGDAGPVDDVAGAVEDEVPPAPGVADTGAVLGFEPIVPDLPSTEIAFQHTADELTAFAEAVATPHVPELQDVDDSAAIAADLVEEAVATYEEQHAGEDEAVDLGEGLANLPPLARALIEGGRVSVADMEAALTEHDRTGQSIARVLTASNLVTEADLMWGMAQEMGLEFVDLDVSGVDLDATTLIPEATARHHNVLVIANESGTPVVAASNPTDVFAMDDLRTIMGRGFIIVVATRSQIAASISRAYHGGSDVADMAAEAAGDFDSDAEKGLDDIQAVTEDAPIIRYVNLLILQALNERASDIHVEPTAKDLRVRFRIDGVLHEAQTAPRSIAQAVVTRLKVMADMNIAEHRIPQDGRISLNVGNKGVDLRMATLPTIHGEKIVMRVLDKSSVILGFGDLGFDPELLATYEDIYTKPYGTILVTGPTGSGKSTTLYTTLSALNSPTKNIITVEDPVELQISGINQVQLNVKAGLTFASALKSILRSDPDIVLVGEIRDKETATIAIEAALTGHLVLATLHTNNAASTPMRLVEMGLEPFLVSSSISAVLAQRLARRLCTNCKEAYEPSEAEILSAGWQIDEVEKLGALDKLYRAVGCTACSNTGYRGRKAISELMVMTEEVERMIIEGGSADDIHRLAVQEGMVTLRASGLRKAMEGETTLEEVLRVVA